MKKLFFYVVLGALMFFNCRYALASVQTDIEKANKTGKTVLLVVSEPGAMDTGKVIDIARQAQVLAPASTVLEMNRSDPDNSEFVARYKLAGVPLPLILLIATNGVVTGGLMAEQASPERLVQMMPSPKKVEVVKALSEKKAVFVVASRNSMGDRTKVLETCKKASKEMKDTAVSVSIDMDDKKESSFLEQLRVNTSSAEPVISVINPQGQVTGNFFGPVEVAQLTQAATKTVKGGCCPGGASGGKGCALPPRR